MPTTTALSLSNGPYILYLTPTLRHLIYRRLFPTTRPYVEQCRPLTKDRGGCLVFRILIFSFLRIPTLVRVTTIYPNGVYNFVSCRHALTFRRLMRVRIDLYMGKISRGLKSGTPFRFLTMSRSTLINGMANGIPREGSKLEMRFGRRLYGVYHFQIELRRFYTSTLGNNQLRLRTMKNHTTRIGAILTTKVMNVNRTLLSNFAFRLNRRSTSVRRNPPRQNKHIGLFHKEGRLSVMFLGDFRRNYRIRGKATSAVRLMSRRTLSRTPTGVNRRFLRLKSVNVLTKVALIYMLTRVTSSRFVLTGLSLTFGTSAILTIGKLSTVGNVFAGGRLILLSI